MFIILSTMLCQAKISANTHQMGCRGADQTISVKTAEEKIGKRKAPDTTNDVSGH